MDEETEMLNQLKLEDPLPVPKLTEYFRHLRNSCASNPTAQSEFGNRDAVLQQTDTAISTGLGASTSEEWTLCLRISAQFLGNLIVNNRKNQEIVWARFRSHLKRMARHGDSKLTDTCLMVLYNILLGSPNLTKDVVNDPEFIQIICESGTEGLEFGQYIVEHLLTQEVDWTKVYSRDIPVRERLFVLDVIEGRPVASVPTPLVSHLARYFCQLSDCILRTVADRVEGLEPVEVAALLRLLASCSPHPPHLTALQADNSFFMNCSFLLKSIHMVGKEPNNSFSAVTKLSAADADDELQSHPVFGFKANLVRVLGNLCWRHRHNQDLMRELDVIPLLLDSCNIDARNPFIIQWVVLAVRNLCEDNRENQAVIAAMTREGVVQSALLTELGLTLHADNGDQIRIVPLRQ